MNNNSSIAPVIKSPCEVPARKPPSQPLDCLGGGAALPCLYRNNSIESTAPPPSEAAKQLLLEAISVEKKYRKSSTALAVNVMEFSLKYGIERLGFLTLTFADHVTDYREASKRFNSLASNVLNERYLAWLKVMERQKSGRIHYHLVVALDRDIRSGFDWAAIDSGNYSSASENLRTEWAYWRTTAKKFRFGRTELLPIKSSHEAIGRYVGKYIGKHMLSRVPEDKGARLVSYSKGCRTMNTKFSWVTDGAQQWRAKVRAFAYMVSERTGCEPTMAGLTNQLGPKWAYNNREFIAALPI